MRPWIRSQCLPAPIAVLLLTIAPAAGAIDPVSYNTVLLKNINDHQGANDCWGYTAPDGTEIAIFGHRTGTAFLDATDPANAVEILNVPGPQSLWRDIKTYQHYAYIVTEGGGAGTGLQIVDLADPLNPVHISTYTGGSPAFSTAHNIWIDTDVGVAYACGASPNGGMHILSLADPANPVLLDFFNPYYIHDLYVKNGRAYAGAISSGSLRIIDVSNPSNPTTIASHFYSSAATHNAWPTADASHCATSDETGGGHMKLWDIANLSNITFRGEYRASTDPVAIIHNILIKNDMAYISFYTAGTRIVDVTDPGSPVEVGYYDTSGMNGGFNGNWGVYPFRNDDVVYSSDMQNGFFILRFTGGFAGDISGVVRDAVSSAPLDSADVEVVGAPGIFETDGAGSYSGSVSGGSYQVITTRFGYLPDTSQVVIPEQGVVVHDVDLQPLPNGSVRLQLVKAGTPDPVVGAVVEYLGTPIVQRISDANGEVLVSGLPAGLPWTARIGKFGHALTDRIVVPVEGATIDVPVEMLPGFSDDFESDQGWIAGAPGDDATDGLWERAIPVGSFWLGIVGPDEDASPAGEGWAYVTENHTGGFVGTSDVDDGKTTLLSPVFDGTGVGTLVLNYSRWFSNRAPAQGNDEFRADVSTDSGATWTNVETVDFGTDSWAAVSVDLSPLVPATPFMQLRFVAEDLAEDQYVEAGIDDVEIVTSATAVALPGAGPGIVSLAAPFPNPFRRTTSIAFQLPAAGPATLEVLDVRGRRVATLLQGERVASGHHRVTWSGLDDGGRPVSPGVFFVRLATTEGTSARKLTVLR